MAEMNRCREPQKTGTQETLREELSRVNKELRRAEELFDVVTEDTLIEACTYRIQTLLTYRTYLLRTARRQGEQPAPIALKKKKKRRTSWELGLLLGWYLFWRCWCAGGMPCEAGCFRQPVDWGCCAWCKL